MKICGDLPWNCQQDMRARSGAHSVNQTIGNSMQCTRIAVERCRKVRERDSCVWLDVWFRRKAFAVVDVSLVSFSVAVTEREQGQAGLTRAQFGPGRSRVLFRNTSALLLKTQHSVYSGEAIAPCSPAAVSRYGLNACHVPCHSSSRRQFQSAAAVCNSSSSRL
jgi:hypothetical protein